MFFDREWLVVGSKRFVRSYKCSHRTGRFDSVWDSSEGIGCIGLVAVDQRCLAGGWEVSRDGNVKVSDAHGFEHDIDANGEKLDFDFPARFCLLYQRCCYVRIAVV